MNYIKQLEEKNRLLEAKMQDAIKTLTEQVNYLNGPKFQGTDYRDNSLMNYVNTNDVISFIGNVTLSLTV